MKNHTKSSLVTSLVTICAFGALLQISGLSRPALAEEIAAPKTQSSDKIELGQSIRIEMEGSTLDVEVPANALLKVSAGSVTYASETSLGLDGDVRISIMNSGKEIWSLKTGKSILSKSTDQAEFKKRLEFLKPVVESRPVVKSDKSQVMRVEFGNSVLDVMDASDANYTVSSADVFSVETSNNSKRTVEIKGDVSITFLEESKMAWILSCGESKIQMLTLEESLNQSIKK